MVPLPIPVLLVPYDPNWPNQAKMHSARLSVLGSVLVIIHHIGSTSVPGWAAKPIIDLMPLVTSLSDLDREQSRIETLGYGWHGDLGIPDVVIAIFRPNLAPASFSCISPQRIHRK